MSRTVRAYCYDCGREARGGLVLHQSTASHRRVMGRLLHPTHRERRQRPQVNSSAGWYERMWAEECEREDTDNVD